MTASPPATDRLDRHVLLIASVVVVGAIMSILDTTIVNVALETLSRELDAPLSDVQWVSTGYLLALATVIPLTGWMSERFGARRVWLTSAVLFVVGSALCGLAWNVESLVVFRVLQGLGGGMLMPVGMILMAQAAGPARVGRLMSIIGVPMLLGPVLGPVIGGAIVEHMSWEWVFYVNVPIGIIGIAMGLKLLPRVAVGARPPRLDVLGLLLLSPGAAILVFGLSEVASEGTITAPIAWIPMVAGALLIAAFVVHALRAEHPLIDMRLFSGTAFSAAAATTFAVGAALFGALLILPLYFQLARGQTPLEAGLLMAPQGLGAALVMPLTGRLTDRVGGGRVAVAGLILLMVGTIPFTQLAPDTPYPLLCAALVVRGLGLGATMMPAFAAAYATLEHDDVPRATSALNVIQRIGGSIGTALLAVVLHQQIADQFPASSGNIETIGASGSLPPEAATGITDAFATTYWWALGLTAVALIPAVILARTSKPGGNPELADALEEDEVGATPIGAGSR